MYLKKRGKKIEDKDTLPQSIKKAEAAKPFPESDHKPVPLEGGKYEILELIGKGGYGKVYKCLSRETGEIFALKRINVKGSNKAELEAVEHEIQLLNTLSHPHIVKYEDSIRSGDFLDIIMEYVEGGQISSILKKIHGCPPEPLIARYIAQVLKGLYYLHQQGVVHRDIKGANILSTKGGVIKLADFGVAAQLSSSSEQLHDAIGTPYWMAPEIIEMKSQMSPACDIWSVGCTVIELLTGNPPWYDLPAMAAIYNIVNKDHPPLPEGISPFLQAFLMECFQKDPNRRVGALGLLKHAWLVNIPGAHIAEETSLLSPPTSSAPTHLEAKPKTLKARSHRSLRERDETPRASVGLLFDAPTPLSTSSTASAHMRKFAEDDEDDLAGFADFDLALQKVSVEKQDAKSSPGLLNWSDVDKQDESGSDTDPFDNFDEEVEGGDEVSKRLTVGFEQAMGVLFPDEESSVLVEGLRGLSVLLVQDAQKVRDKLLRYGLMSFIDLLEMDDVIVNRATLACINNMLYLPLIAPLPLPASVTAFSFASPPTALTSVVATSLSPRAVSPSVEKKIDQAPQDESCKEIMESLISLGLLTYVAKFTGSSFPLALRCEATFILKFICMHNLSTFLSAGLSTAVRLLKSAEGGLADHAVDCIAHAFELTKNKTDLCRLCCKASILSPLIERLTLINGLSLPASAPLPSSSFPPPPPSSSSSTSAASSSSVASKSSSFRPPSLSPPSHRHFRLASLSSASSTVSTTSSTSSTTSCTATSSSMFSPSASCSSVSSSCSSSASSSPLSPSSASTKEIIVQNSAAFEASCSQINSLDKKATYSAAILNLLNFFAAAPSVVKLCFAKHDILLGLIRVISCVSLPLKKIILCIFRQIVMDAMTLTAVVSVHALPSEMMTMLVENLEHKDREVKAEALKSIYSLTSLNQHLQLSAAQAGVVPYLAAFIWANDHLSAFALPILFHVSTPTKETSAAIQETGALAMLFALLKHPYHRVPALACIAQWVKVDLSVESEVMQEKNLEALSRAFRETKLAVHFEKLLESVNMLVVVSDNIPSALAEDIPFREELMSRLRTTSNNAIRILLLKILAPLIQLMPSPLPFIEATQLLPLLATLSKDESSSIVQKLANLIFELASGLAKVSHERRRTLVANAEGRSSKRVPKIATTWQPNESSLDCNLCRSRFSIFNRRHHCRKCGALICSKCSSHRRPLGEGEGNSHMARMCDQCVQMLDRGEKPDRAPISSGSRKDRAEDNRRATAAPPHYALPAKQPHFDIGDFVEVFGITGNTNFNGQRGTVVSSPANARFEVQISREIVRFKAENLKKCEKQKLSEY